MEDEEDEEEYNSDLGNDCDDDEIDCDEEESFHRKRCYMDFAARLEEKMMQPGVRLTSDEREEAELHAALVKHFELNQLHMSIDGRDLWQTDYRRDIANNILYKYRLGRDAMNKQNLTSTENLKKMADEEIKQDMAEENEEVETLDLDPILEIFGELPIVHFNNVPLRVLKIASENILILLKLQLYNVLDVDYEVKNSGRKEIDPLLLSTLGNKLKKMVEINSVEVRAEWSTYLKDDPEIGDYLLIDEYFEPGNIEDEFGLPQLMMMTEARFNRYFGKQPKQHTKKLENIKVEDNELQSNQGGFSWL